MDILKLNGTDKKLYSLVAPLVMNAEVLKQNNGYPFKTSDAHTWFLAMEKKRVVGFLPFVYKGKNKIYIDNYYIKGDDPTIIKALTEAIIGDYSPETDVTVLAHKRHVKMFGQNGFISTKQWKNYESMKYEHTI